MSGVLYLVATPIGNLGDLSDRARQVLASVDLVAAEDTRRTGQLLHGLGISRPLLSLHEHNERARAARIVDRLQAGQSVALVSDAGTPLVSDPGFCLVRAAIAAGVEVTALPGPCAAIVALTLSGLPSDRVCFEGFLPARSAARRSRLEHLSAEPRTLVFYESGQRLQAMLEDCGAVFGMEREAALGRELTKRYEQVCRGALGELARRAAAEPDLCRGELTVVVAGAVDRDPGTDEAQLATLLPKLLEYLSPSQAAGLAAELTGLPRNACYRLALELAKVD
ncbi:MAG: 16S rRNA (cytidine(1402)-2'-O)-methyltransferase [Steroidobacteraceae bacterium]